MFKNIVKIFLLCLIVSAPFGTLAQPTENQKILRQIQLAIYKDDLKTIEEYLKKSPDLKEKYYNNGSNYVIVDAAIKLNLEILELILKQQVNPNVKDWRGKSPLLIIFDEALRCHDCVEEDKLFKALDLLRMHGADFDMKYRLEKYSKNQSLLSFLIGSKLFVKDQYETFTSSQIRLLDYVLSHQTDLNHKFMRHQYFGEKTPMCALTWDLMHKKDFNESYTRFYQSLLKKIPMSSDFGCVILWPEVGEKEQYNDVFFEALDLEEEAVTTKVFMALKLAIRRPMPSFVLKVEKLGFTIPRFEKYLGHSALRIMEEDKVYEEKDVDLLRLLLEKTTKVRDGTIYWMLRSQSHINSERASIIAKMLRVFNEAGIKNSEPRSLELLTSKYRNFDQVRKELVELSTEDAVKGVNLGLIAKDQDLLQLFLLRGLGKDGGFESALSSRFAEDLRSSIENDERSKNDFMRSELAKTYFLLLEKGHDQEFSVGKRVLIDAVGNDPYDSNCYEHRKTGTKEYPNWKPWFFPFLNKLLQLGLNIDFQYQYRYKSIEENLVGLAASCISPNVLAGLLDLGAEVRYWDDKMNRRNPFKGALKERSPDENLKLLVRHSSSDLSETPLFSEIFKRPERGNELLEFYLDHFPLPENFLSNAYLSTRYYRDSTFYRDGFTKRLHFLKKHSLENHRVFLLGVFEDLAYHRVDADKIIALNDVTNVYLDLFPGALENVLRGDGGEVVEKIFGRLFIRDNLYPELNSFLDFAFQHFIDPNIHEGLILKLAVAYGAIESLKRHLLFRIDIAKYGEDALGVRSRWSFQPFGYSDKAKEILEDAIKSRKKKATNGSL